MQIVEHTEKHKGFKETKLGWIPEEWETSYLRTMTLKIMVGIASAATHAYRDSGIILFRNQNIKEQHLNDEDILFIDEDFEKKHKNKRLKGGDILIARTGYPGTACIVPAKYNNSQSFTTLIVRPDKLKINHEYLCYFINSPIGQAYFTITQIGGGQKNVNAGSLEKMTITQPSLQEQKAIAACLTTWDNAIIKLNTLIIAKQQLKKALMQQLLSGKKRLPGFDGEWVTDRFDRFLKYAPRPTEKPSKPFIKLGIRSHCKGTFQNVDFIPTDIAIDTLYAVKPNDLIVNITFAWEGAVAIVREKDKGAFVSHRFPTYKFIDGISSHSYFRQFIKSKYFRYQLDLISPGGAGRNRVLSKKELNKLKIKVPQIEEQTAIAQVLHTADQEIQLLTTQRNQLQLQKKGLMQVLLTGKKRLKI